MQQRMKTHPLSEEKIRNLLARAEVGVLSTIGEDGCPYCTPVHFLCEGRKFYVHGLPKGQKIENLQRNSKVGFCVYELQKYLMPDDDSPCNVNTQYESVIVTGTASMLENQAAKAEVLKKIVAKYTPELKDLELPEAAIRGTGVIEITAATLTGKYYE